MNRTAIWQVGSLDLTPGSPASELAALITIVLTRVAGLVHPIGAPVKMTCASSAVCKALLRGETVPELPDTVGAVMDVETPIKVTSAGASRHVDAETAADQILNSLALCLHLSDADDVILEQADLALKTYLPQALLLLDAVRPDIAASSAWKRLVGPDTPWPFPPLATHGALS